MREYSHQVQGIPGVDSVVGIDEHYKTKGQYQQHNDEHEPDYHIEQQRGIIPHRCGWRGLRAGSQCCRQEHKKGKDSFHSRDVVLAG